MTDPRTMRRQAGVAIAFVWLLVCGGLAWATYSAIQLEEFETATQHNLTEERAKALAISRLDAVVEPVLARERQRPYTSFRPKYKAAKAFNASSGEELSDVIVPSPLERLPGPEWLLLHFQVSYSVGWSSPQVSGQLDDSVIPAGSIPRNNRHREAGPENWLAALKSRFELPQLLEEFEFALGAEIEAKRAFQSARPTTTATAEPVPPRPADRSDPRAELSRRAARAQQLEKENFISLARCEPEKVALENLEGAMPEPSYSAACVEVAPNLMMPVWLDVTLESEPYLALLRTVSVQSTTYCVLQGVLIDWRRLREHMVQEVHDLFPEAKIVPVMRGSPKPPSSDMLQTIPARIVTGPMAASAVHATSSLRITLSVAWLATVLALAAVTYGTLKYLTIAQRRMHFVSAVTHELRTPLTSFQLYSDLLADLGDGESQRRRQYAKRLQTESRRLSRLVENVLAYSHIGDTGVRLHGRPCKAVELAEAIAGAVTAKCESSGKRLCIEVTPPADTAIETDLEFVVQIVANLVENACKYSEGATDPTIYVRLAPNGMGGLDVDVEDGGRGVSPGDRRAVFEPFRRSDAARSTGSGGVGLGLALSRYWAECLGGRLSLRKGPRNLNAFACFTLSLPATLRP